MTDGLFEHIRVLHGARSWDAVLDAGTGRHSLEWVRAMATERWTAITGDEGMARTLREGPARDPRPGDRLVVGNWRDASLLAGEVYDVVLADYLLGALDAFAPYHQHRLFERLRPHVGGRLYVVGLEPWPDRAETPDDALVTEIARVRDATLLLCKERCYREHPAWWVREHLERAGFRVVSGGTDNHVFLLDVFSKGLFGKDAEKALDAAHITVNKNSIPFDTNPPLKASGIRLGSPAVTTRGMQEAEMKEIAALIAETLAAPGDETVRARVSGKVKELTARFPLYPNRLGKAEAAASK